MPTPIKYLRFREVVNGLINEHYGTEVSKSKTKVIESKLIEYAARGKYEIFVPVPYGGEARDFSMPRGDLLSFVGDPSAVVDIGTLDLYDKANDKLIFEYYEFIKPDNPDCEDLKKIQKTSHISAALFRINEEDIPLLAEKIKKDNLLDLKVREGEGKERSIFTAKPQGIKSIEETLSYDKTTGKFRFGTTQSTSISKTSRHKVRDMAEKLMKWWMKGQACPLSEFGIDPKRKTPTHVYDNTSDIRKTLECIKINMPQCADGAYSPPSEPKHFDIINNS